MSRIPHSLNRLNRFPFLHCAIKLIVLTALLCGGIAAARAATVTSVQFPQYYAGTALSFMSAKNYTGGVISVQNWNVANTTVPSPVTNANLVGTSGSALGSTTLINADGTNSPITFSFSGYTGNDHTGGGTFPTAVSSWEGGQADAFIANGSCFNSTAGSQSLVVSGLDATHTYNLILYVTSPWYCGACSGTVSAGGTTFYIKISTLGAWTQATSTTSGSPTTANYVQFNGLTGAASQTVTLTGAAYMGLGGFQVVDQGVVSGYNLSVSNGTGSGTYPAGTQVTVAANTDASGYQFAGWTGATSGLANSSAATTTLTMPAATTSIAATYSAIPNKALTVNSGSGSGVYAPGTAVTVTANAPASGYQFVGWSGSGAMYVTCISATSTTLTMPSTAVSITANYALTTATYPLTVINGSGSGSYAAGTAVTVTATAPASGYSFAGWTGALSALNDPALTTGTVTMPAAPATITANYSAITTYPLTVNGGSGSGSYTPGTVVTVTANAPASGHQFVRWTGTTAALNLADADSSSTAITMQPFATSITASYGLVAPTYAVTVNGGSGSGSYAAGTVLTVTANAPASGYNFTGWTGGTSSLANPAFSTTTLTVPSASVSITANNAVTTSSNTLTVTSGSGTGTYVPGTAVTVTANAPAAGYQFSGWTGSVTFLSSTAAPTATFSMPSMAAAITANYTAISSAGSLVFAGGLERIVPGYSGAAIRIQRPLDNTQQDIGFAAGTNLLDTTAVTNFLGQTQGYITTVYDQSGGGNNLTTPLPTSTATMPTISVTDPTSILVDGTPNLTARDVEHPGASVQGNVRYFVLPASISVNKSQMSAFIACGPDYSGGITPMQLYQVGNPAADAVDLTSSPSGLEGLSHNSSYTFSGNNVIERSQGTVIGLVTNPPLSPTIYLDGVSYTSRGSVPASANCSGGNVLGGTGNYNFLGFALYSGAVSPSAAASISNTMIPRTAPACNIVADGDSITQGTGSVYGFNMVHHLSPLLNEAADITNMAIYGTTAPTATGHSDYPTIADSDYGVAYQPAATNNIYYLAIGTNDLHEGATGATTWGYVQQALINAKALGYKTIVATVMHEWGSENATTGTQGAAFAVQVNNFNALARAAVGQYYLDGIVDYEADPRLGNINNLYPAYSADGTHPNDAGYQIMSTIAAPVFNKFIGAATDTYTQWATGYFGSNSGNGAETATPQNDGVTNLCKYLFDINPTTPMTANAWAAMPVAGMTTNSGSSYLTLTYRQNQAETGLTINVQTSPDLVNWQTVTPNSTLNVGTDSVTGDPMIQYQVLVGQGDSTGFIRLDVVGP